MRGPYVDSGGVLHPAGAEGGRNSRVACSQPPQREPPRRGLLERYGLQFVGFPDFKLCSVIGVVVAAQFVMYFVSLWAVPPRGVISPDPTAMWKIGSSNWVAEACAFANPRYVAELRRWFVPIFLHVNLLHLAMNVYFECSIGTRVESRDTPLAFAGLFFGAGLMGNLFSDAFGVNGVGGSTSCYGLIGLDMASWYKRWGSLSLEEREAVQKGITVQLGFLAAWEIINWYVIDHYGHAGGFFGGFVLFLARTDKKFALLYASVAVAAIVGIAWGPLSGEPYSARGGEVPWPALCNELMRRYEM